VVTEHDPPIQLAHEQVRPRLRQGQGLSGRIKEGEVVESSIQDPWMEACFLDALTDAQFPAPKGRGKVTVTYPFTFVPSRSDGGTRSGG